MHPSPAPCKAAETAQKQRAALAERLAAALAEVKAQRQQAEAARGELEASRRGAAEAAARADRAGAAVDAAAAQAARAERAQAELAQLRGEEGALHTLSLEAVEVWHTPCRVAPPTHPRHHPCHPPTPPAWWSTLHALLRTACPVPGSVATLHVHHAVCTLACTLHAQELERQVLQSLARVQAAKAAQMERQRQTIEVRPARRLPSPLALTHPTLNQPQPPTYPDLPQLAWPDLALTGPTLPRARRNGARATSDHCLDYIWLQAQRREDDERRRRTRECVVCMEASIQVVFVPCGHIVCCAGCAEQVQSCPSCRATIVQRVRTFLDD